MRDFTLHKLVIRSGLATLEQVREALWAVQRANHDWVEELILRGVLDEERYLDVIASGLYVPRCAIERLAHIPEAVLDRIPSEVAIEHRAVPLWAEADGDLHVVVADPTDRRAMEELQFFAGSRVMREVAVPTAHAWALHRYYGVPSVLWPSTLASPPPMLEAATPLFTQAA